MHEGAAGRTARLSAPGEVHAGDDPGGDRLGIGIGKRDQRVLAAELEQHRLRRFRRRAHHRASGRHAADQRDLGHARMPRERGARLASARHDVEHARGQQAVDQFHQAKRRERRLLRRLDDHGVPSGERRGRLARAEHQRMIERDDPHHDAKRLAHREVERLGSHRNREALDLGHESRKKFHLRRRDVRIAHHLAHRVAAVGSVDQCQLLGVLMQDRRDPFHDFRALGGQHARPFAEAGPSTRHRSVDVGSRCFGRAAERFAAAGAGDLRITAGLRRVPAAAVVEVPVRR